jgi:hypothetical protein
MLLLIDFEKAFDSISWSFIYDTLKFFNFGESMMEWVKTFHKDITSAAGAPFQSPLDTYFVLTMFLTTYPNQICFF